MTYVPADPGERHIMMVMGLLLDEVRRLMITDTPDRLRPSQYRVIAMVPTDGAVSITELADRVGMTKQAIGQFVTQLVELGHLTTESDPADRRTRLVRRTQLGTAATGRLSAVLDDLERDWADRVGRGRYREFRSVLDELAGLENPGS